MKSLMLLDTKRLEYLYGPDQMIQISEITEPVSAPVTATDVTANPACL